MEKKLNTGAFVAMDSREMMEVDGGYRFLCDGKARNLTLKEAAKFEALGCTLILIAFPEAAVPFGIAAALAAYLS